MKIDEACIDHNVVNLVNELTASIYEFDNIDWFKMTLAEINGMITLSEELKKVLNA